VRDDVPISEADSKVLIQFGDGVRGRMIAILDNMRAADRTDWVNIIDPVHTLVHEMTHQLRQVAVPQAEPVDHVVEELQGIVVLCALPTEPGLLVGSSGSMGVTVNCGPTGAASPHLTIREIGPSGPTAAVVVPVNQGSVTTVEALAGELWTDYNIHDPGLTILELLETCTVTIERTAPDNRISLTTDQLAQLDTDLQDLRLLGETTAIELQALGGTVTDARQSAYQQALAELVSTRAQELYLQDAHAKGGAIPDVLDILDRQMALELRTLAFLELQNASEEQAALLQTISTAMKARHDAAKSIIRNMK
jgi:hypothetical protein